MIDSELEPGSRITLTLALFFLLVVVVGVVDLILDRPATLLSFHVAVEVMMVLVSLGAASYLARGWYGAWSRLVASERETARLDEERQAWEDRAADLLTSLADAISQQFDTWGLTPAERRVALMLLKGLSHKRIARSTETSERTVRQHAVVVYRKAGLAGRAELAGFFLESLLLPEEQQA